MTTSNDFPQELKDAAHRMRDAVNLHVVANAGFRERRIGFVAIRLDDGRAIDNELYDTRLEAVKHCANKTRGIAYIKVGADSMGERESIIVLQQFRQAFANGVIFAEEEPITPMLSELLMPYIPNTLQKLGIIRPPIRRPRR